MKCLTMACQSWRTLVGFLILNDSRVNKLERPFVTDPHSCCCAKLQVRFQLLSSYSLMCACKNLKGLACCSPCAPLACLRTIWKSTMGDEDCLCTTEGLFDHLCWRCPCIGPNELASGLFPLQQKNHDVNAVMWTAIKKVYWAPLIAHHHSIYIILPRFLSEVQNWAVKV